jgi:hypothetical protein
MIFSLAEHIFVVVKIESNQVKLLKRNINYTHF